MLRKLWLPVLALCLVSIYFNDKFDFYKTIWDSYFPEYLTFNSRKSHVFTLSELASYNGVDRPELYLSVLGRVFDVTSGASHYGPGKSYHIFVGRDSSRSFVTGRFGIEDANDEIEDLSLEELRSLNYWVKFYFKQYKYIGKLSGKYFDNYGKLTPYGKRIKTLIKLAEKAKFDDEINKIRFPPCNVEWDAERGTHVWCTQRSGGVTRDWIGYPRKYYEIGLKTYHCICANEDTLKLGNLKGYEGCDWNSSDCYFKD